MPDLGNDIPGHYLTLPLFVVAVLVGSVPPGIATALGKADSYLGGMI